MDCNNDIEQLLERYWKCQTSVEEEERLRRFFVDGDVPPHLQRYKSWFVYQERQQDLRLGADFDTKVLSQIAESFTVKAKRITLFERFKPMLRAVAVVAVMLMLGNVMRHSFSDGEEGKTDFPATAGEQVRQEAPAVVASDNREGEQHVLADSLVTVKKAEALKK